MWRAMFLAIGFLLMLLGVQCLGVERMTLNIRDEPPAPVSPFDTEAEDRHPKADRPPSLGTLESALLRLADVPLLLHHSTASGGRVSRTTRDGATQKIA